ncbi:hypothetical protein N0K73_00245 [Dellaglioa algida]|uniref:hypothetical protein n=1 Tax=Dellaglioa algida TaxID=105612 RepID=UPI0024C499CC|nr:hypothetical protein [Dellaglioa algida]MDK1717695.1 hypothetical protein [Dellaglioa algida]
MKTDMQLSLYKDSFERLLNLYNRAIFSTSLTATKLVLLEESYSEFTLIQNIYASLSDELKSNYESINETICQCTNKLNDDFISNIDSIQWTTDDVLKEQYNQLTELSTQIK